LLVAWASVDEHGPNGGQKVLCSMQQGHPKEVATPTLIGPHFGGGLLLFVGGTLYKVSVIWGYTLL